MQCTGTHPHLVPSDGLPLASGQGMQCTRTHPNLVSSDDWCSDHLLLNHGMLFSTTDKSITFDLLPSVIPEWHWNDFYSLIMY
jgi:hypothetical protein